MDRTEVEILYKLRKRGRERQLIPWCAGRVVVMAYSPLDEGHLGRGGVLGEITGRHGATPAQVALAWTLRLDGVVSIPKASRLEHVRENAAALDLRLTRDDMDDLDGAFPLPDGDIPLETA